MQDTYDYLCDIAHPSYIGNTRYWSHIEKVYPDGSERRVLEKHSSGQTSEEILNKIIWTLAWSSAVLRNSFLITASGLKQLLNKLKTNECG
ncbi:MAG: hypothetical protein ACI8ZB_005414 [Desulforhopalus sp.]